MFPANKDGENSLYPAYVAPRDVSLVETWSTSGDDDWKPGPFVVKAAEPERLTEWQVVTEDNGSQSFVAAVGLPEFATQVGLPAAVFIGVRIESPKTDAIDTTEGGWSLIINTAELLSDAVLSPLQTYVGRRGVAFGAYLTGLIKNLELPVLRLVVNCKFTSKHATTSGILMSDVTAQSPRVQETLPPAARQDICPHCLRSEPDDEWTLVGRPE